MTKSIDDGMKDPLVPIKIRKSVYRVMKTVSAWKGVSVADYITELAEREAIPELTKMAAEIGKMGQATTDTEEPENPTRGRRK